MKNKFLAIAAFFIIQASCLAEDKMPPPISGSWFSLATSAGPIFSTPPSAGFTLNVSPTFRLYSTWPIFLSVDLGYTTYYSRNFLNFDASGFHAALTILYKFEFLRLDPIFLYLAGTAGGYFYNTVGGTALNVAWLWILRPGIEWKFAEKFSLRFDLGYGWYGWSVIPLAGFLLPQLGLVVYF